MGKKAAAKKKAVGKTAKKSLGKKSAKRKSAPRNGAAGDAVKASGTDDGMLTALLGLPEDDPKVVSYLASLGKPERVRVVPFTYLHFRKQGIAVVTRRQVVDGIQLFAGGVERHSQYKGPLPSGLAFKASRDEVLKQLGAPALRGSDRDRYDYTSHSVVFDYSQDEMSIAIVVISRRLG